MLNSMKRHFYTVWQEHHDYFKHAKGDIALANLHTLRVASTSTTLLILLFILFTPYIVPDWSITIQYIIFFLCCALFSIFSILSCHFQLHNIYVINITAMCFDIMLIAFMIIIDVFPYPTGSCSFTPLYLAVCSAIFIMPYYIRIPYLLISEGIFVYLTFSHKALSRAQGDTFNTLAGLAFGLALLFIVTRIRMNDYTIKDTYKNLSQQDGLTGLYNKYTCEAMIREQMRNRDLSDECALLIVDLDNFKRINDTFGHHVGDSVLRQVAESLTFLFGQNDIIGRFGGDEFIILIKRASDINSLEQKCRRLLSSLQKIKPEPGYSLSGCIGIVKTQGSYISYEDLFRYADDALYEAKNFGKNQYVLHIPKPSPEATKKKCILVVDDMQITRAIVRETFQEDYEIMEASTGREALSLLSQYAKHISVVLLDIYMDDLDGYAVIQFMKSRPQTNRIPVLVITSDPNVEEKALKCGADDMLQKPIDPTITRLRVEKIVKRGLPL